MKKSNTGLRKNLLIMLAVLTLPLAVSCGGNACKSSKPDASENISGGGEGGGPRLGSPGGGPVIDKSGDANLQAMIKTVAPKFRQLEYKDSITGHALNYNLYSPPAGKTAGRYPIIMFMADASTPGADASRPLTQGYGALVWATDEWQKEHPCYVLVPQFSGVAVNDRYERTDEVDMVIRLLRSIISTSNVDSRRVYLTGQSMGGMIAMYYNVAYPDMFAASMFVDSHWATSSFDSLVRQKFIYFIAGKQGKAYRCMQPLEDAARKVGVQYTFAEWSARLPEQRQSELARTMLDKGAPVNIFEFEPESVLPVSGKGSEHMYSFDYAYRIPSVREWIFRQTR